jgi:hypothetical protein
MNAVSMSTGSGIGSGQGTESDSIVKNVTVINGNITATGLEGAEIGVGLAFLCNSIINVLAIDNVNIYAMSLGSGGGIGSGSGLRAIRALMS